MNRTWTYRTTPWTPPTSYAHAAMREAARIVHRFERAMRRIWHPLSIEEQFALRLVNMHAGEGRWDLVEEDLNWMAKKIEERRRAYSR